MHVQLAQPYYLLLAIPVILHTLWMARRLEVLSRARRRLAVTLRVVLVLALVLALAGLRVAYQSRELTVLFAVDRSESVPRLQREFAEAFVQRAHEEMGPDDKQWIVVFGADAAIEQTPAEQPEFEVVEAVVDRSRTNLADAIQLGLAAAGDSGQRRIVVLSDGNQNAGSAEDAARAAAAAGVAIDVVPLRYENRNDVIVEKALVESRVSLDEPFDVKVIAGTRQAARGKLSILQDGRLIGQYDVELDPDRKNAFTIPTQVRDGGYHRFEVMLDVDGDAVPENNRAYAFTYGEGEPRVLLVDGDADRSLTLGAMLAGEKINVELASPAAIPTSLRELQTYDGLIFNNVPADALTAAGMSMIEYAVHDLGLGFMMIGGEHSFGAGGYNDSPIERVLPVDMELKNEKILPQGALVPIVHTVEIPEGQYWAERILQAALDVLSPRDLMGVLLYSWREGEAWLFPLQQVGAKSHLRRQLNQAEWGDMPSFDTTLNMAYDALKDCGASVKHIVIISDGDPQTPNWNLVRKIRAEKITISTVCINPHSQRDSRTMQDLARQGGGNFHFPKSFNKLPQIFIKEATTIRRSLIHEDPFEPVSSGFSPILVGIEDSLPQLRGYVGTSPKSLADVPLLTDKKDPLLAHWRHGLGRTVAFTSDAKERWARAWVTWGRYSKFWSQAVRWMLRSPANPNYQVEMEIDGAQGRVIVDAVDDDGEFRNFLDLQGRIITPSLEAMPAHFRQTGPGRYEAPFAVSEAGTYMLGAQATDETGGTDILSGGTTLSYSPEFRAATSNQALLYRLADLTGGRVLDETTRVFEHDLPSLSEPQPLWPLLLKIVIFAFVLDVFVRRVLIGFGDIAGWFARGRRALVERLSPRRATVEAGAAGQLLDVKQAVKQRQSVTEQEREAFLANLQRTHASRGESEPTSSPERPATAMRPSAQPDRPSASSAGADADESYTGKLLKARSRTRKQLDARGGAHKPNRKDDAS